MGDDSGVGADRHRRPVITPTDQRAMADHAHAHIDTVDAGHLSLITLPNAVVKIIVTASDATT
jgi:hypothetical protein